MWWHTPGILACGRWKKAGGSEVQGPSLLHSGFETGLDYQQGPVSREFAHSRVGEGGLELLNKRDRGVREIKDRNTGQHQGGNLVNTAITHVYFHMLMYDTPKGVERGDRLN